MLPRWISAKRAQMLFAVALLGAERVAAHLFGVELLPDPALGTGLLLVWAIGHCDTMDGPVVTLAKKALEERNVNHVLPWVRAGDEPEVRQAFDHAQAVRELGPQVRALADRHFFETVVRIHRVGEGEPFTGLRPAGCDLGPAIPAADRALETGSPDALIKLLADTVTAGVRARFQEAVHAKAYDPNDVAAGRKYIDAYVAYVHYAEGVWGAASGAAPHHAERVEHLHPAEHAVHHPHH